MKTIKEVSDMLNISKVSIYKQVKKDFMQKHISKKDGGAIIDDEGIEKLRNYYQKEAQEAQKKLTETPKDDFDANINTNPPNEKFDVVAILERQLKEKDEQIKSMLVILENQQKLQLTHLIADNATKDIKKSEDTPKRPFFSKIFKK